ASASGGACRDGRAPLRFHRGDDLQTSGRRMMPERVAIYPGSFDPLTLGHLNLIERGLATFDKLIVAVVVNPNKTPLFSPEERMQMIREATRHNERIEADSFQGLLVDYCEQKDCNV